MSFIDWNNNGKIDPEDIAISMILDAENDGYDNDEDVEQPIVNRKSKHGCLTTMLIFVCSVVGFILMVVK